MNLRPVDAPTVHCGGPGRLRDRQLRPSGSLPPRIGATRSRRKRPTASRWSQRLIGTAEAECSRRGRSLPVVHFARQQGGSGDGRPRRQRVPRWIVPVVFRCSNSRLRFACSLRRSPRRSVTAASFRSRGSRRGGSGRFLWCWRSAASGGCISTRSRVFVDRRPDCPRYLRHRARRMPSSHSGRGRTPRWTIRCSSDR